MVIETELIFETEISLTEYFTTCGTVCHYTSRQHHLYGLSVVEAEAVFVQLQLPVLISCSHNCDFVLGLVAFGRNALFVK